MRQSKSWDYVDLGRRAAPHTQANGYYYNYKFRINISHKDYVEHKESIKQGITELWQSNLAHQSLVYCFKTPSESLTERELGYSNPRFVDNGQFTIYTRGKHCGIEEIRAFAYDIQLMLTELNITPTAPMARDTRISANVSIRSGKLYCFVDGEKQKTKFSSSVMHDNKAMAEGYSQLMADTNLATRLIGRQARQVEFDDIHSLFLFAVNQMRKLVPGDWLVMTRVAVQLRRFQNKLSRGIALAGVHFDLLSELGNTHASVMALCAPVVLRIIDESIKLSTKAHTTSKHTAKPTTTLTPMRSDSCQLP